MYLEKLLSICPTAVVMAIIAVAAWLHSRKLMKVISPSADESMAMTTARCGHMISQVMLLRGWVVAPIIGVITVALPLIVAFDSLTRQAALTCLGVSIIGAVIAHFQVLPRILFWDNPKCWTAEVQQKIDIGPVNTFSISLLIGLIQSNLNVLCQSLPMALVLSMVVNTIATMVVMIIVRRMKPAA